MLIESGDSSRIGCRVRIEDAAMQESVIDQKYTLRAHAGDDNFPVVDVAFFVGVDKGEVEERLRR